MSDLLPLKALCDDVTRDIVDGPFGSELKRSDYRESGVPVLKIQNVKPMRIEPKKIDYITVAKAAALQRHSYRAGDIVLTKLGDPLGVAALVDSTEPGVIVADLVRVRASKIHPKYLCYHLNSPVSQEFINRQQKGTTRPRVTLSVVRDLPVRVTSDEEQRRIVGILDEAFEGIATAKANTERALSRSREVLSKLLIEIVAHEDDGWVRSTLGAETSFIDYRGRTPEKVSDGVRLVTAKNVKMGFVQREPEEFIRATAYDSWMTRGIPQSGDVLFTTEAPLGNVALLETDERLAFAQRVIVLQPKRDRLDGAFLKYALMSPILQQRIHAKATGATVRGIKASLLKLVDISFPGSLKVQKRLVSLLDDVQSESQRLIDLTRAKLAALDALKQSLLHHAFTGQL